MTQTGDSVVVVGAGFAGLSTAVRLAAEGRKVTVLEATSGGGGRARSFNHSRTGYELDNGQHLMMGCYRETLAFLREIGREDTILFQRNLEVNMVKPGGGRVSLRCPALPAPLHLAVGFVRMTGMGALHKVAALRAGLLLRGEIDRPDDNETCDAWLRRMGQTQPIRSAFWDPLIWAVLNDDPLVGSAAMLMAVIDRAFMGTRDASRLGVPKFPLTKLYVDDATKFLEERGSEVRFGQPARAINVRDGRVTGVTLRTGEDIDARHVVTAVPPEPLLGLLPDAVRADPVFQDAATLRSSPIINLWVFLDRPLFRDVPFLGLVDSPLHWLFDRNHIEGRPYTEDTLLNVTISAARTTVDDSHETLMGLFRGEMRRYFPAEEFEVRGHKIVKEKRATISHAAGTYHCRPQTRSPVTGLWLAGDWVRTGLPATIESACQSGHDAARAVLDG